MRFSYVKQMQIEIDYDHLNKMEAALDYTHCSLLSSWKTVAMSNR
jgi:hypothetical protein